MLIQFSVENFMSFKERAVLSLSPSKDREHQENVNNINGYQATNSIAIYGANASGKTSLYKAMTIATIFIRNSNLLQVNQPIGVMPFKFDEKTMMQPSKFEFIFVADDGNRYVYGFSASQRRVHEEYLYLYKTHKPTLIFERNENDEYTFKSQKTILEPLVRFNSPNKLFLATATNWNTESTKIPFSWLTEKIVTFTDAQALTNISLGLYKGDKKEEYLKFTEELLKQADINISKIDIKIKKTPLGYPGENLFPGIQINGQPITPGQQGFIEQFEVFTEHIIGEEKISHQLALAEESLGTNQLFVLGPFLKDAFENGTTIFIDEIDKSLHTFIVRHIVNMFRDKDINRNGAQLIFTTHDTSLLSLETFRRDQVYFTEKDNVTGISDLYSLDEFSVRKTDNIEKGYLLGRYGAIPYIRGEEF
ncbi:hypothetical protein SAMN04487829_1957 [Pseudobutyrivibrio sp. NOR37]|uniref:ATP-binding protein n=2 Tax=Pseudobutyrivibrio TaxID=46205 RepID=A0A2G3E990_9FIRM|nr:MULTISPECIES: ATP-binding protein [Pseudobutyrivibrio]NEX02330.1 ATP-binding protein [Pseudobutyrivibrio xylanivorans]PHU39770.1 ATP-binding protein [Pseudobutyrivibrio ruminis]SFR78205.1 hypothetical protein SAMN04487829_1957 [Pseudobutyrivibrio sp. NOR37]